MGGCFPSKGQGGLSSSPVRSWATHMTFNAQCQGKVPGVARLSQDLDLTEPEDQTRGTHKTGRAGLAEGPETLQVSRHGMLAGGVGGGEAIGKEGKTSTGGYARAGFDQWTREKGRSEEESRAETCADRKCMRLRNLSGPGGAVLRGDGLVPLQDLSPQGWQGPWFGRCIHVKRKCTADLSAWPPASCILLIRG